MKKKPADPLAKELAALALKIAKDANSSSDDGTPLMNDEARLDAFKALTTYHVNVTKINAKIPEEDEDAPNFSNFQQRLKAVE